MDKQAGHATAGPSRVGVHVGDSPCPSSRADPGSQFLVTIMFNARKAVAASLVCSSAFYQNYPTHAYLDIY